jgi:hypothetical protein
MKRSVKNPEFISVCLALANLLGALACAPAREGQSPDAAGRAQDPAQAESALPTAPVVEKDSNGWPVIYRDMALDKSVQLETSEMPAAEQERLRNEYRQTELVQLPVDPRFNASLFRINNVDEYKSAVFIAPRLFTYSSADGARLAPKRNGDGTMTLSFPVVLTDGTATHVQSPEATKEIPLPDFFRVNDINGLREAVRKNYGQGTIVGQLPGCPKKITVVSGGEEFDATPKDLAKADYCELNKPFTVSVRLLENDALYLLQEALYKGIVDVRAVYETRVGFAVSKFKLEFDKAKVFEDLAAALSVKAFWVDADLRMRVTEVMKAQTMKVSIRGDMGPHLQSIVDQAIQIFFTPMRPDQNSDLKECGTEAVCLRLNYNYSKETEKFSVEWTHSTNAMTGQNYVTWTKLKPLQDAAVHISGLKNQGATSINPRETGLTVLPKDILEVTPLSLRLERRELDRAITSRQDNLVCLESRPTYREVCHTEPAEPPSRPVRICRNIQTGTACVRNENQWIRTTQYAMDAPHYEELASPVGKLTELFDGLYLQFSYGTKSSKAPVICAMSSFPRQADGKSLSLRIENRPGCEIFQSGSDESPMVSILNRVSFPVRFRYGRDVDNWRGLVLESHSISTYIPEVSLNLDLGIRGSGFGSAGAAGGRMQ